MIAKLHALLSALIAVACRLTLILSLAGVAYSVVLIGLKQPLLGTTVLGLMAWRRLHRRTVSTAYGSAISASVGHMERGGLLANHGVILGRLLPESPPLKAAVFGLINPAVRSDIAVRSFFAAAYSKRWLSEK